MNWQPVCDGVWIFRDSCNVYAAAGPDGVVVINAGTGRWLDKTDDLPGPVIAVACTHHFRDHSAGAAEAARRGIAVYAPWWEREQFADPTGLFQRRETFIIYDNAWDLFCPIEPIEVAGWLRDGDTLRLAGIPFRVVPAPGVTLGAVNLVADIDGRRVAFCGETIHSPGRIARVAPLQYNYNDLPGAVNLVYTTRLLRDERPDLLAPSLGDPIGGEADNASPDDALAAVETSLRAMVAPRPGYPEAVDAFLDDRLIPVTDHVFQSNLGGASTWFVISESGKALSIDYGYRQPQMVPGYPYPRNRRPLLHGLAPLRDRFGISRIDTVLLTHFHDDHVNAVPMLQRLHGTRCVAGENFAPLLADPMSHRFPCAWPEPIDIEPMPLETPARWEEYTFRLHPITGHTRWSTIVVFEADGETFAATGDQYFWNDDCADRFEDRVSMHNHVYRNGAMLDSFRASNEVMRRAQPTIVLPGHGPSYPTDPAFFDALDRYADGYERIHRGLMPLADDDVHFDCDSRAAWLAPYRVRLDASARIRFAATVRNPFPRETVVRTRMVGPAGWQPGAPVERTAPARAEIKVDLEIEPAPGTRCRRQPLAVDLEIDGRPFGQAAEALVTIGYPVF